MKKIILPVVCLSMSAIVSQATFAEVTVDKSGLWLGAGVGISDLSTSSTLVNGAEPFTGKFDAGYDLNNHIGFYVGSVAKFS